MSFVFRFQSACVATGLLFAVLSITLVFAPELIYWLFDLSGDSAANVLARRAGALFIALAYLCFASSKTKSAELRSIIIRTMLVLFSALIGVGIYDFSMGNAGVGIWVAIVGEAMFVALFLSVSSNDKPETRSQ